MVCPRVGLVGTRGNGGGKGVTPKVMGPRGIGLRWMPPGRREVSPRKLGPRWWAPGLGPTVEP